MNDPSLPRDRDGTGNGPGVVPLYLLAALALLLAGCARERVTSLGACASPGAAAGYNVLLVTIDTARRDHFGCYGAEDARTPTIDTLAAGGILVEDAVTSVPLTLPSHTTLMTGLQPPHHGVHDNGIDALGSDVPTLAGDLGARGYDTAAFVGAFVLDARFGLDRGFDVYDFKVSAEGYRPRMPEFNERSAREVTDAALAWLRSRSPETPFFAWVHYFDPHLPYTSPRQHEARFRGRPYDAEIAFVDDQLARIVRWLEDSGAASRTLVVVTADHGEALGEHGERTHGMFLCEATLRVPLLLWSPTLFDGPRRLADRVVGLVDLKPTIEDLLGIAPSTPGDGTSLLREIPADRLLYCETEAPRRMAGCSPLYGLRGRGIKYIQAPEPELYDLRHDPAETRNLVARRRDRAAELDDRLATWRGQGSAAGGTDRSLSREEEIRLRSLGYTFSHRPAAGHTLPDPKRRIAAFNAGMDAEARYARGDYAGAATLARQILAECDGCLNALRVLAFSLLRQGEADSAIVLLRQGLADHGRDPFLERSLVQALIVSGRYRDALRELDTYAGVSPRDGRVALLRGDCRLALGDTTAAIDEYRKALAMDPHRVGPRASRRLRGLGR